MTSQSSLVGAIDQGTTGTRFVVFDDSGTPIGDGFVGHERALTAPNRVEYDPVEIWESTRAAIQEGLDRAGIAPENLEAIGIASQRQTTVVWDRHGQPVAPAQSWQDRRAASLLASLDEEDREVVRDRTGLELDPYFSGAKLAWLLENETYRGRPLRDAAIDGEVSFGTIDAWLLTNLTGCHCTDVTNAGQSLLFDQQARQWDEELLALFDIPRHILPTAFPCGHPDAFGRTDVGGLLSSEIPITGVIGNQHAALVGQAGFDPGDTKVSYGSGNFVLQNVGNEQITADSGLLSTIWFQLAGEDPLFGLEGPVLTTGTAIEWLDQLGLVPEHGRLVKREAPFRTPGQPVVIPTIAGGGALQWCGITGGTVTELSRFTKPEDIVRATVDGIGFSTRAVLERIEHESGMSPSTVRIDGGAVVDDTFAFRQATLLGRRLIRGSVAQTSALGTCYLAGLACGIWSDTEEIQDLPNYDREFEPRNESHVTDEYQRWLQVAKDTDAVDTTEPSR